MIFKIKKTGLLLLLFVFAVVISGCGGPNVYGDIRMIEPEPSPKNPMLYEDEIISARFVPNLDVNAMTGELDTVVVIITNHSDEPLRIIWDDSAFVNVFGSSSRLAPGYIPYADYEGSIPSSTIPSGARDEISLIPTETVYYQTSTAWTSAGWRRDPIFKVTRENVEDIDGSTIRFLLPIQLGDERYEYDFTFRGNFYVEEE